MQSVGRVCEGVHLLVRALVKKNNVNLCATCAPLLIHRCRRTASAAASSAAVPTAQPLSPGR